VRVTVYYVFHAHSDTATQVGMPSTSDIVNATRGGAVATWLAGAGPNTSIAGPTPRIVRSSTPGSPTAGFHTDVAELIELNPPSGATPSGILAAAQGVADAMNQQLQASDSSWQTGTLTPWSEATNGSVAWWECASGASTPDSCASVTATRDDIAQGTGRLAADENPTGPTVAPNILPSFSDITPWLWLAGGAVVVYMFWPLIFQAIGGGRAFAERAAYRRSTRRLNPGRRRKGYDPTFSAGVGIAFNRYKSEAWRQARLMDIYEQDVRGTREHIDNELYGAFRRRWSPAKAARMLQAMAGS